MSDDEPSVPDRGLENLSLEEASAQHHSPLAPVSSASDLDSASISEASAVSPSSPPDSSQTPLQPHGAVHARDFAASTSSSSKPLNVPPQASTSQNKLGALRNRPSGSNVPIPPGLREKMAALKNNQRPGPNVGGSVSTPGIPTMSQSDSQEAGRRGPPGSPMGGPPGSPMGGPPGGLMARRQRVGMQSGGPPGRMSLQDVQNGPMGPGAGPSMPQFPVGAAPKRRGPPGGLNLSDMLGDQDAASKASSTPFSSFNKIVDPSGRLSFANKAVLHASGVDFSTGASFSIKRDDLQLLEELGRGNYGTVQKVCHKQTKVVMAMKEIRLELDESKLKGIITELDILHRASSSNIVEFYGAFFVESCVYYCMEFMDAGSLEQLAGIDVPEPVLGRVTACVVRGLKFLKDELQTMHRDVKPTNVLVNKKGEVKLCDFGVSAQLEKSLAKTNIGCQSYMAPERIKGESQGNVGAYSVASDVWSLGLSMIEFAIGHYPYPPETYSNVFAQLQAIVHGDPPSLPDGYSHQADDFVAQCLRKEARWRPTYAELQQHPFLQADAARDVDLAGWVTQALEWRAQNKQGSPAANSTSSDSLVA